MALCSGFSPQAAAHPLAFILRRTQRLGKFDFQANLPCTPAAAYNRRMAARQESDLYAPLKRFFEQQGYEIRGEVKDCDLVARQEARLVVVEMKLTFNLTLVLQGLRRQQVTNHVYVAIETPGRKRRTPWWREVQQLCRRLGLGLLTVNFAIEPPLVEVVLEAEAAQAPRTRSSKQAQVATEFDGRMGDFNTGGSTRRPLVTAYRLQVLRVVGHLHAHGACAVEDIKTAVGLSNTAAILQRNYYGWFDRVARGVYALTPAGEHAAQQYADIIASRATPA